MKKQYSGWFVIAYIILAFFCCIMVEFNVFSYLGAPANDETLGIVCEIPTMGAFIIGAIYLFSGNRTGEDSEDDSEHKDNDEANK